jgi:hypothetical protein
MTDLAMVTMRYRRIHSGRISRTGRLQWKADSALQNNRAVLGARGTDPDSHTASVPPIDLYAVEATRKKQQECTYDGEKSPVETKAM